MGAFKLGFSPDVVLDEMNEMKREREADQARLSSLIEAKESVEKMGDFEGKLKELCLRIVPSLDRCGTEEKKDAYAYLDLKVVATPEAVDIKGYLDCKLLTIEQTSA